MSRGFIFDIQRYAVHDGPGIRTLVFMKGCPLRCAWCCNPESQQAGPELIRRAELCTACGRCEKVCTAGAISKKGGALPVFDRTLCSACRDFPCVGACPGDALARAGREAEASEILSEIEQDRDFYRNSGGGVTFSGGEPFQQTGFLGDLLSGCRARGIHTAVETCGYARGEDILALEPSVDMFLFDLKVLDPQQHFRFTGQENSLILENFRRLAALCPGKIATRLTLIPGVSDTPGNLAAMAGLLSGLGLGSIELLEYHPLGLGKWEGLGRQPAYRSGIRLLQGKTAEAARYFTQEGLSCSAP
jgi:pyruvate formate lyase activating enzyme